MVEEYPDVEYRLSTLENVFAEFMMFQNRSLARMERDTERMKADTAELKKQMTDFKGEMSEFKNEMSEFKNEMSEFKNEMRSEVKGMNKKWGEVTNKLGTFAEDFVAPNIPRIAKEVFNFSTIDDFVVRRICQNPDDESQSFEFDATAISHADKKIILTEVKFTVRMNYLENVKIVVSNFIKCFPAFKAYSIIPIFASMSIAPNQVKYLTSQKIYAMALGDENMNLLNFEELNKNK